MAKKCGVGRQSPDKSGEGCIFIGTFFVWGAISGFDLPDKWWEFAGFIGEFAKMTQKQSLSKTNKSCIPTR